MPRPDDVPFAPPLGLVLANTAKTVTRAFDEALAAAGGSTPTWLILLAVKTRPLANQRELAAAVGIGGPTLSHHLDNLERDGLVRRVVDPENRRVQRVELTPAGDEAFFRLRDAAVTHDRRLRQGLTDSEVEEARRLLFALANNVSPTETNPTSRPPSQEGRRS